MCFGGSDHEPILFSLTFLATTNEKAFSVSLRFSNHTIELSLEKKIEKFVLQTVAIDDGLLDTLWV